MIDRIYNSYMNTTKVVTKLISVLAAAAVLTVSVNAANDASKSSVSGTVSAGFSNENYYRGADLGDDTLKVGADIHAALSGIGVFGSVVSDQSINGGADQYYITAGIASKLFDMDLSTGFLHTENKPGDTTGEIFARLNTGKLLNLSGIAYYEVDHDLWTFELGGSHTFDLDIVKLTGRAAVGNTEVTSTNDRTYYNVGVTLNKELTDNVDLHVCFDYVDADDIDDDWVFLTGLQVKF